MATIGTSPPNYARITILPYLSIVSSKRSHASNAYAALALAVGRVVLRALLHRIPTNPLSFLKSIFIA